VSPCNELQSSTSGLTNFLPKPVTTPAPGSFGDDDDDNDDDDNDDATTLFQSKVLNSLYYFII
jgi:hypothetical protein